MNMQEINFLAVVVAAMSAFVVGGMWYSPLLFGAAWMRANNFTEDQVASFPKSRMFGWAIPLLVIMAMNLAIFLADGQTDWVWGMTAGVLAGAGWVATGIAADGLFENKSWTYQPAGFVSILINAGYNVVSFALMGVIIGAWR